MEALAEMNWNKALIALGIVSVIALVALSGHTFNIYEPKVDITLTVEIPEELSEWLVSELEKTDE